MRNAFKVYYRIKIWLLRLVLRREAIAAVLYQSYFPQLVLEIGGATIGKNVRVQRWLTIHESRGSFKGLVIGDDVHIGKFVLLDLTANVTIGDRVGVGMHSKVLSHQSLGDTRLGEIYPTESGSVTIPDDVVLGASSMLLYPSRVAAGTLISAGSVVRGEYEEPCVLIGNPARVATHLQIRV